MVGAVGAAVEGEFATTGETKQQTLHASVIANLFRIRVHRNPAVQCVQQPPDVRGEIEPAVGEWIDLKSRIAQGRDAETVQRRLDHRRHEEGKGQAASLLER